MIEGPSRCRLESSSCGGPIDLHHIVPKQRLRQRVARHRVQAAVADMRNQIPLCRTHHHRISHGWDRDLLMPVLEEQLPELITFAADYRIKGALDHELRIYGLPVVP